MHGNSKPAPLLRNEAHKILIHIFCMRALMYINNWWETAGLWELTNGPSCTAVCVCVCVCVCVWVCVCVGVGVCVYVCVCVWVGVWVCVCVCVWVWVCVCVYVCVCVHTWWISFKILMKTRQCLCFTEILNTSDYVPHKLNPQSAIRTAQNNFAEYEAQETHNRAVATQ
jgi:hypothetical protein